MSLISLSVVERRNKNLQRKTEKFGGHYVRFEGEQPLDMKDG